LANYFCQFINEHVMMLVAMEVCKSA